MEIVFEVLKRLPWEWLAGIAVLVFALDQKGIIQGIFRKRSAAAAQDRRQFSDEQRALFENLERQRDYEQHRRGEEATYYETLVRTLRAELADQAVTVHRLVKTLESSELGNSRLRHGLRTTLQQLVVLTRLIQQLGGAPPPFDGLRNLLGISADLDESLQRVFQEAGVPTPPRPEEPGEDG